MWRSSGWRVWAVLGGIVLIAGPLAVGCGGGAGSADQATVRVAAASDLQYALAEIVDGFTAEHPELRVEVSYGSSGALFQQLVNGAPFDLYLAADVSYAQRLVDEGVATDPFRYAAGRLVVWAGDGSPVDPSAGIEAVAGARRVAIANPAHAPYGEAAVAALRSAGVYDQVADRLVLADNVAQAAELVVSGNVDAGIVALSLAMGPPLRGQGAWYEVPPELFPRLDQGGAVVSGAPGARQLRDYLLGPAGTEVLSRYGFGPAGE